MLAAGVRGPFVASRRCGGGEEELTYGHEHRRWDDAQQLVQIGQQYPRAPIVEAIIEIRCGLPPETTLAELALAADPSGFPVVEKRVVFTGRLDVSAEGIASSTTGEQDGHVFRSQDGHHVLQSRLDGFSFAVVAPYSDWDSFSGLAERHWYRYRDAAKPLTAQRIGVRYINRIEVPGAHVEVKDYLRTAVDVSPYLPQLMNSYFLQVGIPLPQFSASVMVTSTIVEAEAVSGIGLILDIDTWQDVDIDLTHPDAGSQIEQRLGTLRNAKNYVFEASITDATRRLIE